MTHNHTGITVNVVRLRKNPTLENRHVCNPKLVEVLGANRKNAFVDDNLRTINLFHIVFKRSSTSLPASVPKQVPNN